MLDIKDQIQRTSPVSARVSIELPPARVNHHLQLYFGAVAKQAKIQGFRPGKAPVHVVKKLYGEEAASSIGEKLISEGLLEVVRKHDLKLILPPTLLAVDAAKEDMPFRFEAELDLRPEIPSIDLTSITVEAPAKEDVTNADLEKRLDEIRDAFAHFHPAAEGALIGPQDSVVVKYTGLLNGQKLEKASSDRHELQLGTGSVLSEFEVGLQGLKVGDKKTIEVEFPADHQVEEIRGQKLNFEMEVLELQTKHRPNWDEENLVERVYTDAKTLDEVKSKTREQLVAEKERSYQQGLRDAVSSELLKKAQFEVSPRQLQMAVESVYNDRVQALSRMGVSPAEIQNRKEEILKFAQGAADREIKLSYILDQIGREAKLELGLADIEKKLEDIAKRAGISLTDVKKFYLQKEQDGSSPQMDRLQMELRDEKSLDYALSKVTIKNRGSVS
jgi:trigger factor